MEDRHLFRGQRLDNEQWVYGSLLKNYYSTKIGMRIDAIVCPHPDPDNFNRDYRHPILTSSISQCTGLTAAKSYRGTRHEDLLIFERDICTNGINKYRIVWRRDGWMKTRLGSNGSYTSIIPEELEIIGTEVGV